MKPRRKSYEKYVGNKLILRDHLAADRTILANERTILAYVRTVLTAFVAGLTLIKFFPGFYYQVSGWAMLAVGLIITIVGVARCRQNRDYLEKFFE